MIKIRQIKISYLEDTTDTLLKEIYSRLHLSKKIKITYKIVKKSIDARKKPNIYYIYEVLCTIENLSEELLLKRLKDKDIIKDVENKYLYKPKGKESLKEPIIIIGSGPAGLFAAYNLLRNGYPVIVIERGSSIEKRVQKVEDFWKNNQLDENCNIQFGEGGAGTFSDGKLNTLVSDKEGRYHFIMETFTKFGANNEITYSYRPHIGTDVLRNVIINMRKEMIKLGGKFYFDTQLTDILIKNGSLEGIVINDNQTIICSNLILAIGHSARDTFYMLHKRGVVMQNKPFAVGLRIMHPQSMINKSQYGCESPKLPVASYKLTYTSKNKKGVYSFCMCPGGYVINASSQKNHLCINGMSNENRDSGIANSAIIVTVDEKDYGTKLFAGITFQRHLESLAYNLGKQSIPIQLLKDYYDNKISTSFGTFKPMIKGKYTFSNLNFLLPDALNEAMKEGLLNFDKKIKGFAMPDAILCGIESRSSSPIKIPRNENFECNIKGIYPIGEGAGYAGGITSAAIDGLKVSEVIMNTYKK